MGKRVVLAMSGGVDSSVAAYLLKEQGYDVIGLFMRTGAHAEDAERRAKTCCSVTDAVDAQRVADRLDIPFYALDFERDFGRIKDYFADEYVAGRTPNPCVMCNIWLKFGKLWAYGKQVGADFVATGHYARIARADDGTLRVARGHDRAKDQSYVLFGLRPELLPHVLFPVGDHPKSEIRAIAREQGLPVHDKPESQEICFVPDDDYLGFVRERRPERDTAGPIVDEDGTVARHARGHRGLHHRPARGLGIAVGSPRYVVQIEPLTRTVTGRPPRVAGTKSGWRPRDSTGRAPSRRAPFPAWPRSGPSTRPCRRPSSPSPTTVPASSSTSPQTAVTPGQVVTVYQDDLVLGGGWIDRAIEASS